MSSKPDSGNCAFYNYEDESSIKKAVCPLVASNCSDYAVGFSNYDMRPARRVGEVQFMTTLQAKLGMQSFLRLHSYAWPHLVKGRSYGAMVVSAPRSGRTLSYLPPLCHSICRTIEKIARHVEWHARLRGPIAVIVVPYTEEIHCVSALCYALLKQSCPRLDQFTLTLNVPPSGYTREFRLRLFNGVGCLVVTPAQLVWVKKELGVFQRFGWEMRYLVLDNVDRMSERQVEMSTEVLEGFLRPGQAPQLVVVTEAFKPALFAHLTSLNEHPAVIFGDILEAALYGGANFKIILTSLKRKVDEVIQLLRQRDPRTYRTVIFCDDDCEIRELVNMLEDSFYDFVPYYQNAKLDDLERINRWKQDPRSEILLCTDQCPELDVRNAHTLIHYGMSHTWSKFKMRHLFLADNFKNGLQQEDKEQDRLTLHSYAILGDNNQKQLPRLVDFLQQHQKVEDAVRVLSRKIRLDMESLRGVLCSRLLVCGECNKRECEDRHRLMEWDIRSPHLPTSGQLKVFLIKIYSPTHFCVRIAEHKLPDGPWEVKLSPGVLDMRVQLVADSEAPRCWPPVAGDLCLYRAKYSQERVRILKVAPIEFPNLVQNDLIVEVQALDRDTRVFSTTSQRLYACPEALKREPPSCVDIRLLGLSPEDGQWSWTDEEKHETEKWLLREKQNMMMANIVLSTSHAIYVKDLVVMVYASQLQVYLQHLSVRQTLIKEHLARESERAKSGVLDFFNEDNADDTLVGMPPLVPIRSAGREEVGDGSDSDDSLDSEDSLDSDDSLDSNVSVPDYDESDFSLTDEEETFEDALPLTGEVLEDDAEKFFSGSDEEPEPVGAIDVKAEEVLLAKDKVQEEAAPHAAEKEDTRADGGKKKDEEPGAVSVYDPQNILGQFGECLKKCSELTAEEAGLPKNPSMLASVVADLFSKMQNGGGDPVPAKVAKDPGVVCGPEARVEKYEMVDEKVAFARMTTTIGPSVVHPQVLWHQSLFHVEFRFNIPQDNYQFEVHLIRDQLLFQATKSDSPVVYQAILNLGYNFTEYSYVPRGQNVHVRIGKAVGAMLPFNFSAYPCVRANHEETAKQEEMIQERRNQLNRYLECLANKEMAEEEGRFAEGDDDEDSPAEGVEGPSDDNHFSD